MEEKQNLKNGFDYYRIKTEWVCEGENGALSKTKTEELVMATSYTEAEKVAYSLVEQYNRTQFGSVNIEIVKTKIDDVLFNDILMQDEHMVNGLVCNYFEEDEDSGVGLYAVKVVFLTLDEKSGKTKRSTQVFYVPATSNSDATKRISTHLSSSLSDYVIRDAKFDKAASIYWPKDIFQNKAKASDEQC